MNRLIGKKKPGQPQPTLEDVSGKMDTRGTSMDKKISDLDVQLRKQMDVVKKMKGPAKESGKRRAMQILKQKKMYERQRDQLYAQQFNIDQVTYAAATVKDTQDTVKAMKTATKSLKKEMKGLNITKIENQMDEMQDLLEDTEEIQDVLARSYDVGEGFDEDELDGELEALEGELDFEDGEMASYLDTNPELPAVPAEAATTEDPAPEQPAAA